MINPVTIKDFTLGPGAPCFIVAEAGVNHNGDIKIAHKLIDAAKNAGADAVKFQIFNTSSLVTPQTPKAEYQLKTTRGETSQFSMLKQLELTQDEHEQLKRHCNQTGIVYLCTPYDVQSADFLDRIGVDAFKIASTDTINIPFLRRLAKKQRPMILSTGMATLGEIESSVTEIRKISQAPNLALLQCTSEYPAPVEDINLKAMKTMEIAFQCPVGFSDHTPGVGASAWAVAAGACIIEKHFTLDRSMAGPDHRASIEPDEMKRLVATVRNVENALGDGVKRIMPSEVKNRSKMHKSIVAARPITRGQVIGPDDLTCKRPGSGLPPKWWDRLLGKKAAQSIRQDELIGLQSIIWDTNEQ